MPIINKPKVKQKKHGKKKVRVSNKKAVKNGRQQPKPKGVKKKVGKIDIVAQDTVDVVEEQLVEDSLEVEEDPEFFGDLDESDVEIGSDLDDEGEPDGQ